MFISENLIFLFNLKVNLLFDEMINSSFNDATGNITSTVTRTLKLFRVSSGSWGYVQDLTPGALI